MLPTIETLGPMSRELERPAVESQLVKIKSEALSVKIWYNVFSNLKQAGNGPSRRPAQGLDVQMFLIKKLGYVWIIIFHPNNFQLGKENVSFKFYFLVIFSLREIYQLHKIAKKQKYKTGVGLEPQTFGVRVQRTIQATKNWFF